MQQDLTNLLWPGIDLQDSNSSKYDMKFYIPNTADDSDIFNLNNESNKDLLTPKF